MSKRHKGYHQKKTSTPVKTHYDVPMRIIFLEVNGVLIPPVSHMIARLNQDAVKAYKPSVDALNLIISETKSQLVIMTDWNKLDSDNLKSRLDFWGVQTGVFDRTPIAKSKGNGIIKYMGIAGEPESFVILDPESTEYSRMLSPFLVRTNPDEGGLNEKQARRAIEILRGER